MNDGPRFKIDFYDSACGPFGLYFREATLLGSRWKHIDHYASKEGALALYNKIKDLPEYLP
jgi:hypothetical protein